MTPMNPDRWPDVSRVFAGACALQDKERLAYLEGACVDDPALRAEVESLLAAHEAAGPLDQAPLGLAAETPAGRRLNAGARLGPYLIESWVGAGGMGEVYRALDTKLGRAVAIKVLPDAVAHEGDRRSRLEREARALAALNHPHVGAIYGLEESGEVVALVLEFVDGPTLDQRLLRGPLSLQEITRVARQLAEALEAAHDRGIVHRDLKPANIKFTPDGSVKVLDFGLAKAIGSPNADAPGHLLAATRTATRETQHGTIVGTPGYMSPEQARGDAVDKRADIWAFGCVVFEMCSGSAPFAGPTYASATAAVVEREPAWETLPASTPRHLVRLLRRCLTKDPTLRLRDIGEARIALLQGADGEVVEPPPAIDRRRAPWMAAVVAALVGLAGLAFGIWSISSRPPRISPSNVQFLLFPPDGVSFNRHFGRTFFALSPDGSQLAFVGTKDNQSRLYVRVMSDLEARPLSGTEGVNSVFWSPDGRSLAFLTDTTLKRIDLPAGAPVTLSEVPAASIVHGTWGSGGTILLGVGGLGTVIYEMPAAGGTPRAITTTDRSKGEVRVHWPWFLPDGKRFLYTARLADGEGELRLGQLDGGFRPVLRASSNAGWIDPDTIVFVREGVLLGQRFDVASARLIGDPFSMAQPVDYFITTSRGMFSVSRNGAVAYHAGGDRWQLVWIDELGNEVGTIGRPAEYETRSARFSRDGTMLLTARRQPDVGTYDLWRLDLVRHTEERLTADRGSELTPMWIEDESAIVYVADSGGSVPHLFRKDLGTGVEEPLLPAGLQQLAMDVFPGDRAVVYLERSEDGRFVIFRLPLEAGASPEVLLRSRQSTPEVRLSPDGRAMAFLSLDGLRSSLQVVSLPVKGAPVLAAAEVEGPPRWSADGSTLYYVGPDRAMTALAVRTAPVLSVGPPRRLFEMARDATFLDVSRDGRFLVLVSRVSAGRQPIVVTTAGPGPLR